MQINGFENKLGFCGKGPLFSTLINLNAFSGPRTFFSLAPDLD